jgi:hypothetical protein
MTDENYDLLPHKLLADLKEDVDSLRKKMNEPDQKINELILEIESMKDSINDLNTIFQKALAQTKDADPHQIIKVLAQRTETVLNQNETIAKGMVAISDKLEDWMETQHQVVNKPMPQHAPIAQQQQQMAPPQMGTPQHSMGPPEMPGNRTAPMPSMEPQGTVDMPPPPPSSSKKKIIGGLFK